MPSRRPGTTAGYSIVPGITEATAVGGTCALRLDGSVSGWERTHVWRLGMGAAWPGIDDAVALFTGVAGECVRRASGAVVCRLNGVAGTLHPSRAAREGSAAP